MKKRINKKLVKVIVIIICISFLIIMGIIYNKPVEEIDIINGNNTEVTIENVKYVVYIKGEVKKPGLYMIDKDTRIIDLINIAGGLTENANISTINLAAKVTDGMTLTIESTAVINFSKKISINSASLEQLQDIPHIGPALASRIIEYRKTKMFESLEELLNVKGISENLFNEIKEYICL